MGGQCHYWSAFTLRRPGGTILYKQQSTEPDFGTKVMISILELRHIIECGFLPLSCSCTVNPDGSLMIKVVEPSSGRVELLVTGVSTVNLRSSQAIAHLIGELRNEMKANQVAFTSGVVEHAGR